MRKRVSYKVVGERFYIMINNHVAIIDGDNQVENGIIHIIDKPIDTEDKSISAQISEHKFFSIFNSAIAVTDFADAVSEKLYNDSESLKDELQNEYKLNRTRYKSLIFKQFLRNYLKIPTYLEKNGYICRKL